MFQLNSLQPLVKKRKRIGRGGSRGGTSGRGHKGQKARSGGSVRPGFEGGQMPLFRRLPKRGFTNAPFKQIFDLVNLCNLENIFKEGESVDRTALIEKGFLKAKKSARTGDLKVKVLGGGVLTKKLIIIADAFSNSAIEAIRKAGGEVRLTKGM